MHRMQFSLDEGYRENFSFLESSFEKPPREHALTGMLSTSLAPLREAAYAAKVLSPLPPAPGKLVPGRAVNISSKHPWNQSVAIFLTLQSAGLVAMATPRLGIRVSVLYENSTEVRYRAMETHTPPFFKAQTHMATGGESNAILW